MQRSVFCVSVNYCKTMKGGHTMSETVTVTYASKDAMKNAVDELLRVGIPQEKFFVDKKKLEVKVITSTETRPEIEELLNMHATNKSG